MGERGMKKHVYGKNHTHFYGLEWDDSMFIHGADENGQGHGGKRERTGNLRRKMAQWRGAGAALPRRILCGWSVLWKGSRRGGSSAVVVRAGR